MKDQQVHQKPTPKQQRNMQLLEERYLLLDTIREMIDDELDRRGVNGSKREEPQPPQDLITQEEMTKEAKVRAVKHKSCCRLFCSYWERIASRYSLLLLL